MVFYLILVAAFDAALVISSVITLVVVLAVATTLPSRKYHQSK